MPGTLWAGPGSSDRRFLFVFARGGWDQGYCFAPELLSLDGANADPDGRAAELNGISFIDNDRRPNVADFFRNYGDRTAVINGIEIRSIAHDMCTRLLLTGSPDPVGDDWAAIVAGHADSGLDMPHVQVAGPSYSSLYTSSVVRVGLAGQFNELLDGSALSASDLEVLALPASVEDPVETYLRDRSRALEASALPGTDAERFFARYGDSLEHLSNVQDRAQDLDLSVSSDVGGQMALVLSCFEQGLTRSGFVTDDGYQNLGWDTHGNNAQQHDNFELLFTYLNGLMAELDSRTGPDGKALSQDTVVVVFSEMGRTPRLNHQGGKDHWTFTSAMLIGAGVNGGRSIGGYDDSVFGQLVDLATGEIDNDNGVRLTAGHLGATILALADVDPTPFTGEEGPLEVLVG
jgi:hypothetical protein